MLKRISFRKLSVATCALFALFLLYLVPKDKTYSLKDKLPQDLSYVSNEVVKQPVFLLDQHNMVARTLVPIISDKTDTVAFAKEIIQILTVNGAYESKIPSGFKAIIPAFTKLSSIEFEKETGLLKVNFSKEFLEVPKELEEKLISALVYSLTTIDDIKHIILYVEGSVLSKLPQSNIVLPSTLNKNFGINKQYDLQSTANINQVTVYYISEYNKNPYYVPVTKYVNDTREKIKIVIDDLTSTHLYHSNLMSYLNSNTKLLNVEKTEDLMELEFNQYIFNDAVEKQILEEVIYSISLSIEDNYDVKEVIFEVENDPVYKSTLKEISGS